MANVIGNMYVRARMDVAGIKAGTKEGKAAIRKFRLEARNLGRTFRRVGKNARTATAAIAGLAAGAAYAIKRTVDFGDALAKSARALGISSQKLAMWRLDAKLAGVENDSFQDGLEKTVKRFREYAATGAGAGKRMVEAMGITRAEIDKMSNEQIFNVYLKKLREAGSETKALEYTSLGFASKHAILQAKLANVTGRAAQEFKKLGLAIRTDDIETIADEFTVLEEGMRLKMLQTLIDNKDAILNIARTANEWIPFMVNKFAEAIDWFQQNPFLSGTAGSLGMLGYVFFGRKGAFLTGAAIVGGLKLFGFLRDEVGRVLTDDENPFVALERAVENLNEEIRETLRLKKSIEPPTGGSETPPPPDLKVEEKEGPTFGENVAKQFAKATSGAESFRTAVEGIAVNSIKQLTDGLGSIASDTTFKALMGDTIDLKEAFKQLGASIIANIVGSFVQLGAQMLANFILQKLFVKKTTAVVSAAASAQTALWTTPATLAAVSTLGAAVAAGTGALTGGLAAMQAVTGAFQATSGTAALGAQGGGFPRDFGRPGPRDTVHAMIAPREHVMREAAADSIGAPALDYMNRTGQIPPTSNNYGGVKVYVRGDQVNTPEKIADLFESLNQHSEERHGTSLAAAVPSVA